jgi:guanyl-specific ribonuclease Sa/uncharacterized protein YukE
VASEVIPGSPDEIDALAAGLSAFASVARSAVDRLGSLTGGSIWVGEAAGAFAQVVDEVPRKLGEAASSFGEASAAVASYAEVLRDAQRRVDGAIALYRSGEAQTSAWEREWQRWRRLAAAAETDGTPEPLRPTGTDPGARERSEAERLVARALADVEDAAVRARDRLREAGRLAPDEPGFFSRALGQLGQFGLGIWDSTWGMAELVWSVSPARMIVDPAEWATGIAEMGEGIVYGVAHPVEFAKAVSNWDMWMENPARALGQLVPDLVIAVATAGGGAAGATGRRAADAADSARDLARAADAAESASDLRRVDDLVDTVESSARTVDSLSPTVRGQIDDVAARADAGLPPAPGVKGNRTFANDGRHGSASLPSTTPDGLLVQYREWDLAPPVDGDRGFMRVVTGSDGSVWYTDDHYRTFLQIGSGT